MQSPNQLEEFSKVNTTSILDLSATLWNVLSRSATQLQPTQQEAFFNLLLQY